MTHLKNNWPTKKLEEVCELVRGTEPGSERYFNENGNGRVKFIRVGDLTGKIDNPKFVNKTLSGLTIVNPNEILISFDGTPGVVIKGWSGAISSGIRVIRNIKPEILNDFLFYYLQTSQPQEVIKFYTTGITILHASRAIPYIEIPVPPLKIQHLIVERLDTIKKAQELNDKQIALADELFQSLLHRELKPQKDWPTKKLGEVIEAIESGSRPRGGAVSVGVPSLGVEHINDDGSFNIGKLKYIPEDFFESLERGRIKKLDILIAKDGATTGKTVIVGTDFPFDKAAVNEHLFIIRGNPNVISQKFLFYTLFGSDGKKQILKTKHGAAQGGINQSFVNFVKISLPPIEIQQKIVEKLSAVEEYKKKLIEQKDKLQELFDSVLNKSFKGEL